jgi:hypothetical protein
MMLRTLSAEWKHNPSQYHLSIASSLPDSILLNPIDTILLASLTHILERNCPFFSIIFLQDPENSNITGLNFSWDQTWEIQ